ncbi:ribosome biogenesis GTPase Der [Oceanispirochaeta sp.]|uniref:ribosome biogenesis GTPase Der n=1 Tax=Oceanispirochaeta sp. TaxID=2035350 RepID=UPI00262047BF|nr:ribosome biogenesis GTPase Der [Oceanispirochaeta sp.]MDA3956478.1 ribosome biogenesis GTPase Der [Oceanispirochaeta sp.]
MNLSQDRVDRLPRVVIAGRPNVGKSTLFNRIIKKRKAITDPTPGVTRDIIQERCFIRDQEVMLMDTGGFKLERDDSFDELVAQKSLQMLKEGDLILFVMDVNDITSEDETFIESLRAHQEKVLLVVNKVDHPDKENEIWNLYSLGFQNIIGVSATHGWNLDAFNEKIISMIDFSLFNGAAELEKDPHISIAILGKPNTGKSTLTNQLSGKENSIVSPIAGTTRDVIEGRFLYKKREYKVLDTAGIRRKKKVVEDVEYYSVNRAFHTIDDSDIIFLLIDIQEGLTEQDKKISQQIVNQGKGVVLVLNKWDTTDGSKDSWDQAVEKVRFLFPILSFAPVMAVSGLKGTGLDKLLDETEKVYRQLTKRVETSQLNESLHYWMDYNPIPSVKNKRYKLLYLTQVTSHPVKFVLFVNREKGFPDSYKRYIMNQIRKEYGMSKIPINMELKERS